MVESLVEVCSFTFAKAILSLLRKSSYFTCDIGQLIFHTTGPVDGDYSEGRGGISGKYQHTNDLDELIHTWNPEQMLPRAYKDKREKPAAIKGLPGGLL